MIKILAVCCLWAGPVCTVNGEEVPKVFSQYLTLDQVVKADIVAMVPPDEIQPYVEKVQKAAEANPEWFEEYSAKSKQGVPLPYHERLGLTKEEYAKYLEIWDRRAFKALQPVKVRLEKDGEHWMIRVGGVGSKITLLRYDAKEDRFISPNGSMKRLEDIKAEPASVLRGWTGHEWKFEEESAIGKTKENFAIGKTEDKKFGLLVHRLQDISSSGRPLYDQSLLIRFALPKPKK